MSSILIHRHSYTESKDFLFNSHVYKKKNWRKKSEYKVSGEQEDTCLGGSYTVKRTKGEEGKKRVYSTGRIAGEVMSRVCFKRFRESARGKKRRRRAASVFVRRGVWALYNRSGYVWSRTTWQWQFAVLLGAARALSRSWLWQMLSRLVLSKSQLAYLPPLPLPLAATHLLLVAFFLFARLAPGLLGKCIIFFTFFFSDYYFIRFCRVYLCPRSTWLTWNWHEEIAAASGAK